MGCSMLGFPVHNQLLELVKTPVHWVSDAIQPSHPLLSPFPPALSLSQHQGFFPVSQLFASGGQIIGASALASILPVNIQSWFPLRLTGLIFLLSKGVSGVFSNTTIWKHQILWCSVIFMVQLSHPYMTTGKTIALTRQTWKSHFLGRLIRSLGVPKEGSGILKEEERTKFFPSKFLRII